MIFSLDITEENVYAVLRDFNFILLLLTRKHYTDSWRVHLTLLIQIVEKRGIAKWNSFFFTALKLADLLKALSDSIAFN